MTRNQLTAVLCGASIAALGASAYAEGENVGQVSAATVPAEDFEKIEVGRQNLVAEIRDMAKRMSTSASQADPEPAGSDCVFGETLVEMARMRDIEVGLQNTLTLKSNLSVMQQLQIMKGMHVESLQEAFESTDERQFWVHEVQDKAHGKSYTMYIYSGGDNIHGFIFVRDLSSLAATIGDGSIYACKAAFNNYGSLPWFYTN